MKPYQDPDLPMEERVHDLISRMTLEEKISQMVWNAPAIERLGIPEYNWWNECLHGVGRAGNATVFPQAIGLAATWDTDLALEVATAISDEARAKHHAALRCGNRSQYFGLTFWTPNINIFRDPRWGRGHETYGEDPYLTGRIGVSFVNGLQGADPKYLKLVATAKHYAVHSGPEALRHTFDAVVSPKDLRETYLPAFKALVKEANVACVMGAYNRTNGEPCCGSKTLLQQILRDEWGFRGHVVSDCGAICDFDQNHKVTSTPAESAALAVNNGCDLNCGEAFKNLKTAYDQGLVTEEAITVAVTRLFDARFRLGMFDPPDRVQYAQIPPEVNDCEKHRELSRQAARESIVLLKNNGALPLSPEIRSVAVVGPTAATFDVLLGNYNGFNQRLSTILEGICGAVSVQTTVNYHVGCALSGKSTDNLAGAVYAASCSDVVIAVVGLSPRLEGEEGDASESEANGDRSHIELPESQEEMLKALKATGKPLVAVLLNGSAVGIQWIKENADAIVDAWYPGEEGGNAVADVLFGKYNPAGRLPITFYQSTSDLPAFTDYRMEGHTYRYFRGQPLFPFGFGLSFTTFQYQNLSAIPGPTSANSPMDVSVEVTNTGNRAGDEVVQLYITDLDAHIPVPICELRGFRRIHLRQGESKQITFHLEPETFVRTLEDGTQVSQPGRYQIHTGGGQPNTTAPGNSIVIQRT